MEAAQKRWKKSSRTQGANNCVECAHSREAVHVRDSKKPDAGTVTFPAAGWAQFLAEMK